MNSFSWSSPAKLNLFLHLTGKRADGYHTLQTVFQLIDFHDELIFTPRADSQITCSCLGLWPPVQPIILPEEDNLVIKAARLLQPYATPSQGVNILLKKRIPIGSGLGGGSSNAATTLLALNVLWKLNLSVNTLQELALSLGADVPIFLKGKTSWGEGIGEQLQAITLPKRYFVVLVPSVAINTKKLFSHPRLTYRTTPIRIQTFLNEPFATRNDFEKLVRQSYPKVAKAIDFLNHYAFARLSGTGSCVFAECETPAQASALYEQVKFRYPSFRCKGLVTSPLQEELKHCSKIWLD